MDTGMDLDSCRSMIEDELIILESIYPSSIATQTSEDGTIDLQIELEINLPGKTTFSLLSRVKDPLAEVHGAMGEHGEVGRGPREFRVGDPGGSTGHGNASTSSSTSKAVTDPPRPAFKLETTTLPPLSIRVRLPPGYPGYRQPQLVTIQDPEEAEQDPRKTTIIAPTPTPMPISNLYPSSTSSMSTLTSHPVSTPARTRTRPSPTYLPTPTVRRLRRKLTTLWKESGGTICFTNGDSPGLGTGCGSGSDEAHTRDGEEDEGSDVERVDGIGDDAGCGFGDGSGGPVLWGWLDWVASGEGILEGLDKDPEGGFFLPCDPEFPRKVRTHARRLDKREFESQVWDCGICLESKKGRFCVKFDGTENDQDQDVGLFVERDENRGRADVGCRCVFCKECLSACWTLAIKEGNVEAVSCPSITCTKRRVDRQNRAQDPHATAESGKAEEGVGAPRAGLGKGVAGEVAVALVQEVVGVELRERLEWLKRKKRVENDPTYTTCPLQHCQSPVPPPPLPKTSTTTAAIPARNVFRIGTAIVLTDEQVEENRKKEEDKWERYRQCPGCRFSFCRYCLTTWHGPHLPCPLPSTSNFLKAYLALSPDSPDRKIYHRRYGKKNLDRLQAEYEENEANRKWFEGHTRECCGCGTRVQKSQGCNHMICSKCNAHFCYRCGQSLRPSDPYMHFRTPGSCCFEKLFDADEIARFEREIGGDQEAVGWDEMVGGGVGGWW